MTKELEIITDLIAQTRKQGADAADAIMVESNAVSISQRLDKPEMIERAESTALGLRAFIGKKQAIVSASDTNKETLSELVERVVYMAQEAPEDPYVELATEELLAQDVPELELCDPKEPTEEQLINKAKETEAAALAVAGITNSEGAEASHSRGRVALATSNGFAKEYASSSSSISVCVLAGEGTNMERDYEFSSARFAEDLDSPEAVGQAAAEKALKRLNPKKVETCQVPVVFDPRVSKSLVGNFASAINGSSIARGTSFLKDAMGTEVFSSQVSIIDDPHRKRGLASKPFDGEGVAAKKQTLVAQGNLQSWLLDLRSANQLGLKTTGHASRGIASPPAPSCTNLYMEAGECTAEELLSDIKDGFYVTDLFGMGVNLVTGDYSQGASGFWIENGVISYPVSEITIAGHLSEMFASLVPANDLEFKYGINAPTVLVERMTVAGA